ncbi:MAG TPA: DUF1835 domain-containing protein [Longimicrobiaceae bacterium]|nr:DUF1835 domain-containing protein [Longimicrobiaceae bacterium]
MSTGPDLLHVTSGDAAAQRIALAVPGGEVLPWRDVLHEGPVPAGLPPEGLNRVRARFLAEQGWAEEDGTRRGLDDRDRRLAEGAARGEVVLWFEHDLYDQLQLLQVLDLLAETVAEGRVSLVCIGSFPGVEPFHGLGQLTPGQLAGLLPGRAPVTAGQRELARAAWAAFRAPDPEGIESVLAGDTGALPFLRGALVRHLEQFPAVGDGLARTERQLLEAVAAGAATRRELFLADQAREERVFMGDTALWGWVRALTVGPEPLLRVPGQGPSRTDEDDGFGEQRLELTDAGREVLRGGGDRVALGGVDRWLGGVHLRGRSVPWRWNRSSGRLAREAE